VWMVDVKSEWLGYKSVPVNGDLDEISLPKVDRVMRHSRPAFDDDRIYLVDGKGVLIAPGAKYSHIKVLQRRLSVL
jgi:hypothetical protein